MTAYTVLLILLATYMALCVRVLGHYVMARTFNIQVNYIQFGRGPLLVSTQMPYDSALCGVMMVPWCGDISINYERHGWLDKLFFHLGGAAANLAMAVVLVFLLQFLIAIFGDPTGRGFLTMPSSPMHMLIQLLMMFVVTNLYCLVFSFLPLPGTHTWEIMRIMAMRNNPKLVQMMDINDRMILNILLGAAIVLILSNRYG